MNRLDRTGRRLGWRKNLPLFLVFLLPFLDFKLADFRFNLRLEFVRGPFEFVQGFADLPGDSRELFRPEQQQRQNKKKGRVGEIHGLIIKEQQDGSNQGRLKGHKG